MWYSITTLLLIVIIVNVKLSSADDDIDEDEINVSESIKFKKFIREEYEQIMTYLTKEMEKYKWNHEHELYFKTLKKIQHFMSYTYKKIQSKNITADMYDKRSKFHKEFKKLEVILREASFLNDKSFQQIRLFNYEILLQKTTCLCPYNYTECDPKRDGYDMKDIDRRFSLSRNLNELIYYWKNWREEAVPFLKVLFVNDFNVRMDIALKMDYTSILNMDVTKYDTFMMLQNIDMLWSEMKPFYDSLHNFALLRLRLMYPKLFRNEDKYIPAHIFGKNYDSDWLGIYDVLQPYESNNVHILNVTDLTDHEYNKSHVFVMADLYYQSFGFESIVGVQSKTKLFHPPQSFKYDDQMYNIVDGVVKSENDFFETFELWMSLCYRLERDVQTVTFRNTPNQVIEDAIKRCIMIKFSDKFFKDIGLRQIYKTSTEDDLNVLLRLALKYIVQMAYGYTVDKWRMDVYSGNVDVVDLNKNWWKYRMKYQKIKPPIARMLSNFDPGGYSEYTLRPDHTSHFLALLLTFQFHRALCIESGQYYPLKADIKPLYKCDLYGSDIVSTKLKNIMSLGSSQHWSKIIKILTGDTMIRVDAIYDYFRPLNKVFSSNQEIINNYKLIQSRRKKRKKKFRDGKRKKLFSDKLTKQKKSYKQQIEPFENYEKAAIHNVTINRLSDNNNFFTELNMGNIFYISCIVGVIIVLSIVSFIIYHYCSRARKKREYSFDNYAGSASFPFITYPMMNRSRITRRISTFFDRVHKMFIDPEK